MRGEADVPLCVRAPESPSTACRSVVWRRHSRIRFKFTEMLVAFIRFATVRRGFVKYSMGEHRACEQTTLPSGSRHGWSGHQVGFHLGSVVHVERHRYAAPTEPKRRAALVLVQRQRHSESTGYQRRRNQYELTPCLAPLKSLRSDIHVISSIDNAGARSSGPGNGHHKSISGVVCGCIHGPGAGGALSTGHCRRMAGKTRFNSLQVGVARSPPARTSIET